MCILFFAIRFERLSHEVFQEVAIGATYCLKLTETSHNKDYNYRYRTVS